jgi:hypothetical protein
MTKKMLPCLVVLFLSGFSCTNVNDGNVGKMAGATPPKDNQDTVRNWFDWDIVFAKSSTTAARAQQLKAVEDHIRDSVSEVNGFKKGKFSVSFRQDPASSDSLHYHISTDLSMPTWDSISSQPVHNPQPKDRAIIGEQISILPHPRSDSVITPPKQINPIPTYIIGSHKTVMLKQAVDCVYVSPPSQQ